MATDYDAPRRRMDDDIETDSLEGLKAAEEEFGIEIPDDAAETIQTYGDAVKFIEKTKT